MSSISHLSDARQPYQISSSQSQYCSKCKAIRYPKRIKHYDDELALRESASDGCPLCQFFVHHLTVYKWYYNGEIIFHPSTKSMEGPGGNYEIFTRDLEGAGHIMALGFWNRALQKPLTTLREIQPHPELEATFQLASQWMMTCRTRHKLCSQAEIPPLPTRVVDVSSVEPRLVISNGKRLHYAALSHCWGPKSIFITETTTIEARMKRISISDLPKTFRDAITITRRLGLGYLWIDSICIIQDSADDWSRESGKMRQVYQGAHVTISAAGSSSAEDGILLPRKISSAAFPGIEGAYLRLRSKDWAGLLENEPLSSRAWTLQERLLSRRLLHYTNSELLWECYTCTARESDIEESAPKGVDPMERFRLSSLNRSQHANVERIDTKFGLSVLDFWYIAVQEYTKRNMTKISDKLPAISGLASSVQQSLGYSYLAGLWEEEFHDGLLWVPGSGHNLNNNTKPATYRAPSWSWASVDGTIVFNPINGMWRVRPVPSNARLISGSTTKSTLDPMGEVCAGHIVVSAHAVQTRITRKVADDKYSPQLPTHALEILEYASVFLDDRTMDNVVCEVILIVEKEDITRVNGSGSQGEQYMWMLLVIPSEAEDGAWQRIGVAYSLSKFGNCFKDCERREFRIE